MRYINQSQAYGYTEEPIEVMSLEEVKEYADEENDDYFSSFAYGLWSDDE